MRRVSYACFDCRVAFKKDDFQCGEVTPCPNCGGDMHQMGWSFKAPRRRDANQWKKVQILFAEGFRFFGEGHSDSEPLPEALRDVPAFLQRHPDHRLRVADRQPELLP